LQTGLIAAACRGHVKRHDAKAAHQRAFDRRVVDDRSKVNLAIHSKTPLLDDPKKGVSRRGFGGLRSEAGRSRPRKPPM
jgi:hypothetical protein